jgi:tryptophanyl-tRNA synthetase
VMSAFTTETKIRKTDPGIPESCVVCQLRRIYDPGNYQTSWEEDRQGVRGCVQNKRELIEVLNAALDPIRRRRKELLADPAQLERYLKSGADRARATAAETMKLVRKAMKLN